MKPRPWASTTASGRTRAKGEEMIQSEPKSESDLTVCVRRHPSGGPTAVYRFSDIDGFHRDRVSDGVGRETSHDALFGYPHNHRYFTQEQYDDFLNSIIWGNNVNARDHDATCLSLTVRLR